MDGDHRQNVLARHHAVHVEIAGPDSPGYQVYRESGSPTLRAIIDQAGRIEDAWLVSGPALPMETLRSVTTGRYGPYLQNRASVDMETRGQCGPEHELTVKEGACLHAPSEVASERRSLLLIRTMVASALTAIQGRRQRLGGKSKHPRSA